MNRFVSYFCKIFLKPVVERLFIKRVKGWENIPNRNFILATNHQSHLDQLMTGYLCVPRRFTYIGQTDRYTGFDRFLLHVLYFVAGVIRVNREKAESREKAKKEAIDWLKKGGCLIIYPEGTRTRTGKIQQGKFGVAKIFLKTGVPILPVGIKGAFELMPPGTGLPKIKRIIKINVGKPLFFEKELARAKKLKKDSKQYREIIKNITQRVMSEIKSLVKEMKSSSPS